jgi:hypothetical protein
MRLLARSLPPPPPTPPPRPGQHMLVITCSPLPCTCWPWPAGPQSLEPQSTAAPVSGQLPCFPRQLSVMHSVLCKQTTPGMKWPGKKSAKSECMQEMPFSSISSLSDAVSLEPDMVRLSIHGLLCAEADTHIAPLSHPCLTSSSEPASLSAKDVEDSSRELVSLFSVPCCKAGILYVEGSSTSHTLPAILP